MQIQQREVAVSEIYPEAIAVALAFPMNNVVQRYAKDHGLPLEVAREHEVELKKYLALCALRPGGGYGMSRVIDELWHTFIFFTFDYHRFCEEVAGRYLHHQPATEEDLSSGKNIEDYLRTLSEYRLYFGEPPVHLWPIPTSAKGMAETTCDGGCTACGGSGCSGSGCTSCRG